MIYQYPFTYNSCPCIYTGPTLQNFQESFQINVTVSSACDVTDGASQYYKVKDPMQAIIDVEPQGICVGEPISITNESEVGCNGDLSLIHI